MEKNKTITDSTRRHISKSKKEITILFTDIEESTKYWDKHGDMEGRLMVDRHNRLLFPVIKKFNGKVIKTIGDSIMASFQKPDLALKTAIAMQQILEKERQQDKNFKLRVRIGIHAGEAIVEHGDVFGDVVNVAARVESQSKGSKILLSRGTASKIDKKEYGIVKKGSFQPKGKKRPMVIYSCNWQEMNSLIEDIKITPFLAVVPRQKVEILIYSIASLGILYFLYLKYLRYLIADSEDVALLFLNPQNLWNEYPVVFVTGIVILQGIIVLFFRIKTIPFFFLRILKGGFVFSLTFVLFYLAANYLPINIESKWNEKILRSDHLFVEVLEDDTSIYAKPSFDDSLLQTVNSGTLLLLTDVRRKNPLVWNKVLIRRKKFGWILRIMPPKIGVPEKRLTIANKFYFRYKDLWTLLIALIGFFWGFYKFRILPA